MQSSPRKLVGQRSECDEQRTLSDSQDFVADFSLFSSPKDDENVTGSKTNDTGSSSANQSQPFAGVCGAFHIYRKPSPSN